jgi:hypothetical protein
MKFFIQNIHIATHFAALCYLPHHWLSPNYVAVPEIDNQIIGLWQRHGRKPLCF